MNFICDVHIPIRLSKFLASHATKSIYVNQVLNGSFTADAQISQYADQNDYILITKDKDFRNSYFLSRTSRKLIRVCLGNISNNILIQVFENQLAPINQLNLEGSFYMEINPDTVLLY